MTYKITEVEDLAVAQSSLDEHNKLLIEDNAARCVYLEQEVYKVLRDGCVTFSMEDVSKTAAAISKLIEEINAQDFPFKATQ